MKNLKYGDIINCVVPEYRGRGCGCRNTLVTVYFVKYIDAISFYYMRNKNTPQDVFAAPIYNIAVKLDK